MVILANCALCGVLGEGLTVLDWRLFLGFCPRWGKATWVAWGDEGAFEGQTGLALSSGKFRSAGSPLMTIVDNQVGQAEAGSQFFLVC